MHSRLRAAGIAAVLVALLAGCGSSDDWSEPHAQPTAVGTFGTGFVSGSPAPESTITPKPGSWDDVRPPKGYRVVLLTAGSDAQTRVLVEAVTSWARDASVSLKTVTAAGDVIQSISDAMNLTPDLIIAAGHPLIDPLALVTANHLDRQFLVIGAELAEPTTNVTAADWTGASYRGEGLGMSSTYNPATFTPARAARAVRAGVAAILNNLTGIVLWID